MIDKFVELTREKINAHTEKYNQIMQYALKPFGYSYPSLEYSRDIVVQNKSDLMNTFNNEVSNYMNRYPYYPRNVRFT